MSISSNEDLEYQIDAEVEDEEEVELENLLPQAEQDLPEAMPVAEDIPAAAEHQEGAEQDLPEAMPAAEDIPAAAEHQEGMVRFDVPVNMADLIAELIAANERPPPNGRAHFIRDENEERVPEEPDAQNDPEDPNNPEAPDVLYDDPCENPWLRYAITTLAVGFGASFIVGLCFAILHHNKSQK